MVKSRPDHAFDGLVYVLLTLVGLVSVFPVLLIVSISVTPIEEVIRNGGFVLIPDGFTLEAYRNIFEKSRIVPAFSLTVTVAVVGTAINLILTTLMAFPLSNKNLPGRNIFIFLVVFTLLFSGGLIPTYLIVKSVGLLNTFWALIIPNAIASFNVLLMKTFFENIPKELFESARIDGAKELRILRSIVLPLSVPLMLTIGLFYLVGHWNTFFPAIMYTTKLELRPLQVVLRDLLAQSLEDLNTPEHIIPPMTMRMAAVVFATTPIIIVYPFIQKYFTQGMLLGSIKG